MASSNALERNLGKSAHSGNAFEGDQNKRIRADRAWLRRRENAFEGCLSQGFRALAFGTALRLARSARPNRRVQLTPLAASKIVAILTAGFVSNVVSIY